MAISNADDKEKFIAQFRGAYNKIMDYERENEEFKQIFVMKDVYSYHKHKGQS